MPWNGFIIGFFLAVGAGIPVVYVLIRSQQARRHAAERCARDASRMAGIGAMTGGLAHEIKNPLSTIGLNAQLLAEAVSDLSHDDEEKGRLLRRIDVLRHEVERLGDILQDFLQFAGEIHLELKRVNVNDLVEEIADFYLPQAEHNNITLRTELHQQPLEADVDASQLKQAILNLILNATQAMTGAGSSDEGKVRELILRTEPDTAIQRDRAVGSRIHVIDTGPGIAQQTRDRIFQPYFTTRSTGSGLGLPTTKRLVEAHGGTISVYSDPDRGTDFVIVLPSSIKTPPQ